MRKSREYGLFTDVPDEQWNDWKWQLKNRIETLEDLKKYINLTEEENHAIYYHNGKYTHTGYDLKETPLQMLLHFADLWSSRTIEMEVKTDEDN